MRGDHTCRAASLPPEGMRIGSVDRTSDRLVARRGWRSCGGTDWGEAEEAAAVCLGASDAVLDGRGEGIGVGDDEVAVVADWLDDDASSVLVTFPSAEGGAG